MKYGLGLIFRNLVTVAVFIHTGFGVFDTFRIFGVFDCSGKGDKDFDIVILLLLQIPLDFMIITDRCQSGCGNYHHFSLAIDGRLGDGTVSFHNDHRFILQVVRMHFLKAAGSFHCRSSGHFWIFFHTFGETVKLFVSGVIFQHIQDKTFFNSLSHGVGVKRFERAIRMRSSES